MDELKNELMAFDQGLFNKTGRHLHLGKGVHHQYDKNTIEKLYSMEKEFSEFTAN